MNFFAGIGPFVNFLTSSKNYKSDLYKDPYRLKEIYVGGKAELGISHDIEKVRISLVGSYMYNLSPSASTDFITLNNKTFSAMLSVGYKIN